MLYLFTIYEPLADPAEAFSLVVRQPDTANAVVSVAGWLRLNPHVWGTRKRLRATVWWLKDGVGVLGPNLDGYAEFSYRDEDGAVVSSF